MINKQLQQYQQNKVTMATPGELTLMLYNGLIKFIKLAIIHHDNKDISGVNENLLKSQDIVKELMIGLNMNIEVSKNLAVMYDYLVYRLTQANVYKDRAMMVEALGYAEEFRDMWVQVMKMSKQE